MSISTIMLLHINLQRLALPLILPLSKTKTSSLLNMAHEYSHDDAEGQGCDTLFVGCTSYHWMTAARVTLCILTLGLSELVRGRQGWCECCFTSSPNPSPGMSQTWGKHITRVPVSAGLPPRNEMGNTENVATPPSAYNPNEWERGTYLSTGFSSQNTGTGVIAPDWQGNYGSRLSSEP
jgi:hypothetical protein